MVLRRRPLTGGLERFLCFYLLFPQPYIGFEDANWPTHYIFAFSVPSTSGLEYNVEIFISGMVARRLGIEKLLPKLVLNEGRKPQSFGRCHRRADGRIFKVS
jgi:hypothetical protein